MATRRNSKTQPVIEATEQDSTPVEATTNIPDLGAVIDNLPETIESRMQAVADEAAVAAGIDEKTESEENLVAVPPAPKAARKRVGANGIISQPGGSKSKYGVPGGAAWSMGAQFRDGITLAICKLIAVKPGIELDELSCVIHGQDEDGNPTRRGTTSVQLTWDMPRKGVGVERRSNGLYLLPPEGHDVREFCVAPCSKLDGLIEARGRADLAELIDEAVTA